MKRAIQLVLFLISMLVSASAPGQSALPVRWSSIGAVQSNHVYFTPDGNTLLIGNQTLSAVDVSSGILLWQAYLGNVEDVGINSVTGELLVPDRSSTVRRVDPRTGLQSGSSIGISHTVTAAAVSSDGKRAALVNGSQCTVFDLQTNTVMSTWSHALRPIVRFVGSDVITIDGEGFSVSGAHLYSYHSSSQGSWTPVAVDTGVAGQTSYYYNWFSPSYIVRYNATSPGSGTTIDSQAGLDSTSGYLAGSIDRTHAYFAYAAPKVVSNQYVGYQLILHRTSDGAKIGSRDLGAGSARYAPVVAFSPQANLLAVLIPHYYSTLSCRVELYSYDSNMNFTFVREFTSGQTSVAGLAATTLAGYPLVLGSQAGSGAVLRYVNDGSSIRQIGAGVSASGGSGMSISGDGQTAVFSEGSNINFYSLATGNKLASTPLAADRHPLFVGNSDVYVDEGVKLRYVNGTITRSSWSFGGRYPLDVSPDHTLVASYDDSNPRKIFIGTTAADNLVGTLTDPWSSACFVGNDQFATATVSDTGEVAIRVYSVSMAGVVLRGTVAWSAGQRIGGFFGLTSTPSGSLISLTYSYQGASGDFQNRLLLIQSSSLAPTLYTLPGLPIGIHCATFSPTGSDFIYGDLDGTVVDVAVPSFLDHISLEPATVYGGTKSTGKVWLTAPASSDLSISLSTAAPASVPKAVTVTRGSIYAQFTVSTTGVSSTSTSTIKATEGQRTATAAITILPPELSKVSLSPAALYGGADSNATVVILGRAPTGGLQIAISSGNAAASVPASVTIPAGSSSTTFAVHTSGVSSLVKAAIKASLHGLTKTATLQIKPPLISSVAIDPPALKGGNDIEMTVTILGIAPAGGYSVSVTSNSSAVHSRSVAIPAGQSSATFSLETDPVSADANVTITAAAGGASLTAPVTVQSPSLLHFSVDRTSVAGGKGLTGTIVLDGPAYANFSVKVSSDVGELTVPGTINFSLGKTYITFDIGTAEVASRKAGKVTVSLGETNLYRTITLRPK